ncbi:MAG: hypothetical protein AAB967_02865 [Patescibacteria group bacterium]
MDNEQGKKPIGEEVLRKIKSGAVRMRPKWHFALRAALFAAGAVIVFLALLYLVSFTLFALRRSGVLFVPAFGAPGWYAFLASVPWVLVLAAVIFIFILEALVRHYSFAHRRPLLYSLLAIVLLVLLGGFFAERAQMHGRFMRYAEERRMPFARGFYREFGMPHLREIHRGAITSLASSGLVMMDQEGETFTIAITPRTRLPFGMDFAEGDSVVVFGPRKDGMIDAFGIREITPDTMDMPFRGPRGMHPPFPMPRE